MPSPDPDVAKKADLTVLLFGATLFLLNGEDEPNDFVHIKKNKWLRWHNRTRATCTLKFYKLPEVDDAPSAAVGFWPFVPQGHPPEIDLPPGGLWKARLRDDLESGVAIKYDIELRTSPHIPKLDPVIIVRP